MFVIVNVLLRKEIHYYFIIEIPVDFYQMGTNKNKNKSHDIMWFEKRNLVQWLCHCHLVKRN